MNTNTTKKVLRPVTTHIASIVHIGWALSLCWVASLGCNRNYIPPQYPYPVAPTTNTFGTSPTLTGPASVFAQQQTTPQLVEAKQRLQDLDASNRQLTSQLAQAQQQAQAYRDQLDLLSKQLQDTTSQLRQVQLASEQWASQARGMQASVTARGGARLTANNSVAMNTSGIQITGAAIIPDGDLIRIRLSSDQTFVPGTLELNPTNIYALDQVAATIVSRFGRQRIAVEGHTDNSATALNGTPVAYQVAGAQAQAVLDYLVRRGGLPPQQLFVVAHGPNHPIADNQLPAGQAANRRIELVIYPETY
ncbi:MAG: OmpA family protein [Planctomycetales bacterium]|nr:OmpA family protein [Planctomycetales bacterium]